MFDTPLLPPRVCVIHIYFIAMKQIDAHFYGQVLRTNQISVTKCIVLLVIGKYAVRSKYTA